MSQARDDDDPRDAHLLAALRHAPDRDALPPSEVSERILAAARAAVRVPSAAPWWQRLSAWLMQPQVAAAFGTLVVASLVGVMWSTREPPVAEVSPSAPIAERVDQQAMAAASATRMPAQAAKPDAAEVAAAPAPSDNARDKPALPPPSKAVGKDAAERAESRARATAEPAAAPPATTTPPAASPPVAAPSADAAVPATAAERQRANEGDTPISTRQQAAASARSAPEAAAGLTLAAKARAAEPLALIDAALAAGAGWQVAGVAVQHGLAQQALWSSVQEATRGRWQAAPQAMPPAPWLVLEPGSPRMMLWIVDGALHVTADGRSWRAPVDAALLADWQAQVARW
jgi:hypothetical protein